MKKFAANLLLTLTSIIFTIALCEVALRFTPFKNLGKAEYGYPQNYFVADDVLGYDIAPNSDKKTHYIHYETKYEIFSNESGCFDYSREVPDDYWLVVGDSFAWGYAPLEKKWTSVLEKLSGNFILKCGVTGYGTKQELLKAKKVIKQVGKNPKLLIVMYYKNDFNDDFFHPHRTVSHGYLINTIKEASLLRTRITRYSSDEIEEKYQTHLQNIEKYSQKYHGKFVLYKLYKIVILPRIKGLFYGAAKAKDEEGMPFEMTEGFGAYGVELEKFFDMQNRKWYNVALDEHKKNITDFKNYSDAIGTKLLFVDVDGTLEHPRFDDVRARLKESYYDLSKDYPNQKRWNTDGHWNVEGNADVGTLINKKLQNLNRNSNLEQ